MRLALLLLHVYVGVRLFPALGLPAVVAGKRAHARVLIVEDNPYASDALHMLLELLGHKVHVVRDGPAALDSREMPRE